MVVGPLPRTPAHTVSMSCSRSTPIARCSSAFAVPSSIARNQAPDLVDERGRHDVPHVRIRDARGLRRQVHQLGGPGRRAGERQVAVVVGHQPGRQTDHDHHRRAHQEASRTTSHKMLPLKRLYGSPVPRFRKRSLWRPRPAQSPSAWAYCSSTYSRFVTARPAKKSDTRVIVTSQKRHRVRAGVSRNRASMMAIGELVGMVCGTSPLR